MDNKQRIYVAVGGVAAVLALIYLMNRRDNGINDVVNADLNNPFTAPYYSDGKVPSAGFVSNIEVNVDTDAFAGLSNQYMPVFGFVGVGVTGSLPRTILNTVTNTVPPAPVAIAAAPAPSVPVASGWTSSGARRDGYYDLTGASPRGLTSNLHGYGGSFSGG